LAEIDPYTAGGHAVEFLRDLLLDAARNDEPITVVPLAPMTNLALLLRTYPEAAAGLREIVFMGGAAGIGNATASAEFNVWTDPEAAAITLAAAGELGVPVTMYGLDVFYDVKITLGQAEDLVAAGRAAGRTVGRAGRSVDRAPCARYGSDAATIGDGRRGVRGDRSGRPHHPRVPAPCRAVRQLVAGPDRRRHPRLDQ
jgi:pyrimidine-specific ribonucleoside hydrolase